jgi:hypothetical protein
VQLNKQTMKNPHFATLTLTNVGRDDISSPMFDANRPIVFEIRDVGAVLPHRTALSEAVEVDGQLVRFGPDLLHRRGSWAAQVVTEGPPTFTLIAEHMINVQVAKAPPKPQQVSRGPFVSFGTLLRMIALGFALGIVVGLYFGLRGSAG